MMAIDIEKPLEQRLHELESIVWSIGPTLNLRIEAVQKRFDTSDAIIRELSARMASMENQQSALQTDIRDMRGGVTRMLLAQDETIRDLAHRMDRLEAAQVRLEAAQERLEVGQRESVARFDAVEATLAEILRRLPKT
jgi:outer membrane protein TolC